MPRRQLTGCGGFVFHVMNRSAKQLPLFDAAADYELFLKILAEADLKCPIRLLEYCVMPNHWHLLVWPEMDHQLSAYMRWITGVHGQRWRQQRGQSGRGAVYQGRFRWVAIQDGEHYEIARQYVRQNPVRARLVEDDSQWAWSSASDARGPERPLLSPDPLSGRASLPDRRLDPASEKWIRDRLHRRRPPDEPPWLGAQWPELWRIDTSLDTHRRRYW